MTVTTLTTTTGTDIAADILLEGGATWHPEMPAPTGGFMVSRAGAEMTFPTGEFTGADLAMYAALYPLESGEFYGAWVDGGTVYLDVSANYADRREAMAAGRAAGQLAVWDLGAGEEIRLTGVRDGVLTSA